MLPPMRYKNFTWPHNPSHYTITFERLTAVHKVPLGVYTMEDLGRTCRVMRGSGAFCGPGAYDTFKALATVFYDGGAGVLIHPVWMTTRAYFTELKLLQEPTADYVAYSFAFQEGFTGYAGMTRISEAAGSAERTVARYHTVVSGDSLWKIGNQYGRTVAELLRLNPSISNPNLIFPGQKVRVQ